MTFTTNFFLMKTTVIPLKASIDFCCPCGEFLLVMPVLPHMEELREYFENFGHPMI